MVDINNDRGNTPCMIGSVRRVYCHRDQGLVCHQLAVDHHAAVMGSLPVVTTSKGAVVIR